jgi:hypothetical protein
MLSHNITTIRDYNWEEETASWVAKFDSRSLSRRDDKDSAQHAFNQHFIDIDSIIIIVNQTD